MELKGKGGEERGVTESKRNEGKCLFSHFHFSAACYKPPYVPIGQRGYIYFPYVLGDEPPNKSCTWLITVPKDKIIIFHITRCVLGEGEYIEFRDGMDKSAVWLGNVSTGTAFTQKRTTSGRYLLVSYKLTLSPFVFGEFNLIWNPANKGEKIRLKLIFINDTRHLLLHHEVRTNIYWHCTLHFYTFRVSMSCLVATNIVRESFFSRK